LKCGFQKKIGASKSPTFFSRKPLALIVLRLQSKSLTRKILLKFSSIILTTKSNFIRNFFSSSHFESLQKIKMVFAALTFLVVVF